MPGVESERYSEKELSSLIDFNERVATEEKEETISQSAAALLTKRLDRGITSECSDFSETPSQFVLQQQASESTESYVDQVHQDLLQSKLLQDAPVSPILLQPPRGRDEKNDEESISSNDSFNHETNISLNVDLEQTPAITGVSHDDRPEPSSSITAAIGFPVEELTTSQDELLPIPEFLCRSQTSAKITTTLPSPRSSKTLSREASLRLSAYQSDVVPGAYRRRSRFSVGSTRAHRDVLIEEDEIFEDRVEEDGAGHLGDTMELAVAIPVEDDIEVALPNAVEVDPEMLRPKHYKYRRSRLFGSTIALTVIVLMVGIVLIRSLLSKRSRGNSNQISLSMLVSEEIDLKSFIQQLVASDVFQNNDPASPYERALQWILHDDPLQLTVEDSNLMQRYLVAYLYFALTQNGTISTCSPPKDPWSDSPVCTFRAIGDFGPPIVYTNLPAARWLSNASECDWGGIRCDKHEQIIAIQLGKRENSVVCNTRKSIPHTFVRFILSFRPSEFDGNISGRIIRPSFSSDSFLELEPNNWSSAL